MCCRTDQATAVRLLEKHHRGFRGTEPKASGTTAQLRQGPPPPSPTSMSYAPSLPPSPLSLFPKTLSHPHSLSVPKLSLTLTFSFLPLSSLFSPLIFDFASHPLPSPVFISISGFHRASFPPPLSSSSTHSLCSGSPRLCELLFLSSCSLSCSHSLLLSSPACCHGARLRCQTMHFSQLHGSK